MIDEVMINGIKYIAVDEEPKEGNFSCKDCDIFKAQVPKNRMQIPLCVENEVNEYCYELECRGIRRIWKKATIKTKNTK
jgi:hypothetical protein